MSIVTTALLSGDFALWEFNDGVCRSFLVVGRERALLWDTGIGECDYKKEIARITDKPYDVVLSHGHWDHIGGIAQFDEIWMNTVDRPLLEQEYRARFDPDYDDSVRFLPLTDGQRFPLGGLEPEVIFLPGHSDGCVALIDPEHHFALTGDMFVSDAILLFSDSSDFAKYTASVKRFMQLRGDVHAIYASHCDVMDFEDVDRIRSALRSYLTYCQTAERFYLKIVGKEKWVRKFSSNGIDLLLRDNLSAYETVG